jgi:hypothetical protein
MHDPAAASAETLRLGAIAETDPPLVSRCWALIALEDESLGKQDEADAAMDRSLAMGAAGIGYLPVEIHRAPEKIAAARDLVERAAQRHPRNPDVAWYQSLDLLLQGDLDAADLALDRWPAPLPWRLESVQVALKARLRLMQGRDDEALAMLSGWLDHYPRDTSAIAVLLEAWTRLGRPDDATMIERLQAARSRNLPPALSEQIDQTLETLLGRAAGHDADAAPDGN